MWLKHFVANIYLEFLLTILPPKQLFLCLTSISTYSVQYNGKHYKQLHGTAMGPPVSVAVAEIVMQNIEEHVLASPYGSGRKFEDMK